MPAFADLLSRAAAGFDVAVVRFAQGIARATAGPEKDHLTRLAELQVAARAWARVSPEELYVAPPPLTELAVERVRPLRGGEVVDLSWGSGYVPIEPSGRAAFQAFVENRTAHARLLRHHEPRPTLVCLHGYRAGVHRFEEIAWNAKWLFHKGLDVALLTLPFHGLRAARARAVPPFPSARIGRTIEGFAQAIWDLRSLMSYLRARGAPLLGLAGMSMGGYTAALASTIVPDLSWAILFIPLGDLTTVAIEHQALRGAHTPGWLADAGRQALTLIRPLSRKPLLSVDRMLVCAADGDRITANATHAERLADHFGAPLVRFSGAHLLQLGRRKAFREMAKLLGRLGALEARERE